MELNISQILQSHAVKDNTVYKLNDRPKQATT